MPEDPLVRWAGVVAWDGEITCVQSDVHDILNLSGTSVVGSHRMAANYRTGIHLAEVTDLVWEGEAEAVGDWTEESKVDTSGFGFTQKSGTEVLGGGGGTVRGTLRFTVDATGNTGSYSLRSTPLVMNVTMTTTHFTDSGLPDDPGSELVESSEGTRTIHVPLIENQSFPDAGLVLTGAMTVGMAGSVVANVGWVLRPGPRNGAVIENVSLMNDDFSRVLDWNRDVIGLRAGTRKINIQIIGRDITSDVVHVEVATRLTNHQVGSTSVTPGIKVEVPRDPTAIAPAGRAVFRRTLTIKQVDVERAPNLEVATIVRPDGTSDQVFRNALIGYTTRGIAVHPIAAGRSTGEPDMDVPDALRVLESGGVEILNVRLLPDPGVSTLEAECARLIRSPADIVYVSGHGRLASSCLSIEHGNEVWECWADSAALEEWNFTTPVVALGDHREPALLIIAGCSVLTMRQSDSWGKWAGPGTAWAAALLANPLSSVKAILGYRYYKTAWWDHSAPKDAQGGDLIASEMAQRVLGAGEGFDYVQEWLEANMLYRAWAAVGLDQRGYWQIERKGLLLRRRIVGPFQWQSP